MSQEEAKVLWNGLPRRLKWTKEIPLEPGWYWHDRGVGFGVVIDYVGLENGIAEGYADEMWAGPIPEPEDA